MSKGIFITFEGIDGSGKSTQAKMLGEHYGVEVTQEPWDVLYSQQIDSLLHDEYPLEFHAKELTELFLRDRFLHYVSYIKPRLDNGEIVICDRYDLSTVAYQSAQGEDIADLIDKHEGLGFPDITFYLSTPIDVCLDRMEKRKNSSRPRFEKKDSLIRISEQYFKAILYFENYSNGNLRRIVSLDGEIDKEAVHKIVLEEIDFYNMTWSHQNGFKFSSQKS